MGRRNPLDFEAFSRNEAIHNASTKYLFCKSKNLPNIETLQRNYCIFHEEKLIEKDFKNLKFRAIYLSYCVFNLTMTH